MSRVQEKTAGQHVGYTEDQLLDLRGFPDLMTVGSTGISFADLKTADGSGRPSPRRLLAEVFGTEESEGRRDTP